jgi:hypothetical protein
VCDRWRESFEAFVADMGDPPTPAHQIERKDNDGNYEPDNCRWATASVQARNRRSNDLHTINGETKCLAAWLEIYPTKRTTVLGRLARGWPIEMALTAPLQMGRPLERVEVDGNRASCTECPGLEAESTTLQAINPDESCRTDSIPAGTEHIPRFVYLFDSRIPL